VSSRQQRARHDEARESWSFLFGAPNQLIVAVGPHSTGIRSRRLAKPTSIVRAAPHATAKCRNIGAAVAITLKPSSGLLSK